MKKLFIATCLTCALAITANAAEGEAKKEGETQKRPAQTAEQKALRKEINDKYDTNKDGKLDKEERAKMSEEDKAKLEKAGMGPRKKKEAAHAEGEKK